MRTTLDSSDYQQILMIDVYPAEVNWALLIDDITRHGIVPAQQAAMLGKGWSTLQRWLHGSEPRFAHGHQLLALHQKVCGPDLTIRRFEQMSYGE